VTQCLNHSTTANAMDKMLPIAVVGVNR